MTKNQLRWIIGLDPGESTGVLVLRITDNYLHAVMHARYQGEPAGAIHQIEEIIRQAALWQERVLIAGERYTTTDRTGKRSSQPTPLRVLGAAEQLTYSYTNVEFTLQQPADAKKLAPNDVLRDLEFYTSAGDVGCRDANDVNDAARHALLGLARRKTSIFDALLREADRRRTESQR